MASLGKMASLSQCAAWGANSCCANSRAVSAKARCSSVSSKAMVQLVCAAPRKASLQADGGIDPMRNGRVIEPTLRHRLGLRIEQHHLLAIRAEVTQLRGTRTGE